MTAAQIAGGSGTFVLQQPMLGRVAYWKSRSRGAHMTLWEGNGAFGAKMFAQVDRTKDGRWEARYGLEEPRTFPGREEAVQAVSDRIAKEFDVEVRTSSRVIVRREGGVAA